MYRVAGTALKYGAKAYQHYQKYKPYYKTAYATGMALKQYASKRKNSKPHNSRPSKYRKVTNQKKPNTWSKSNSAFKKTASRRRGTVNVDGTYTHTKTIKYKKTSLGRYAKLVGGQFVKERYQTGILYHDPADDIYTQKSATIDFLFDGGVPVVNGMNVTSLFNEMYSNQNTTAPLYSTGAVVNAKNEGIKFYLDTCILNLEFTNMSAGASHITFYLLMARNTRFTGNGPSNDWTSGLIADQGSQTTAADSTFINSRPTQSKHFNMNWKVVEMKTFNAGPGAKVLHTTQFSPRSVVDASYFDKYNQVRGLTYCVFAVTHGQLGLTEDHVVVPKPVQWIYSIKKTYKLRTVSNYATIVNQSKPLNTTIAVAGDVAVREDDGELEE